MKICKTLLMVWLLIPTLAFTQSEKRAVGDQYLNSNFKKLNLSASDLSNLVISDMYQTKHNGLTHIFYQQTRNGIPVHNAVLNLNISKEDKMIFHGNTFIKNLDDKINTHQSVVNPEQAVGSLLRKLGIQNTEALSVLRKAKDGEISYAATPYSIGEIKAKQKYYAISDNDVRLVWDISFRQKGTTDVWSSRIDAVTGIVVDHQNLTLYCSHDNGKYHNHSRECNHSGTMTNHMDAKQSMPPQGSSYNVYPLPLESPIFGSQQLVTDPHFIEVSPNGWHDIDGNPGAEFFTTRGNNANVYPDEDGDNADDGTAPNGGTQLVFDYAHLQDEEPAASRDADVVNLFYVTNMVHNITYMAGFDEVSGNFQLNNFGRGGRQDDNVNVRTLVGGTTNNASFSLSNDGGNSQLNMFSWNIPRTELFSISEPAELNMTYNNGVAADGWGFDESYTGIDLTANIVQALDSDPQFAANVCGPVANAAEVNGNIALIYRGLCEFGTKSRNAQTAGAVAVIICNVPGAGNNPSSDGNDPMGMGAGLNGLAVTIPVLSLGFGDCNRIVAVLKEGGEVVAKIKLEEIEGPSQYSSGFDNGIIIHEFGHGISSRLTGGPNQICLGNVESMGEGWSDFFSLALTVEEGDSGSDARGIGNYVLGESIDQTGIRRFPFSTDMSINPQTYSDLKVSDETHDLGEIWTDMLWDLYWAYVGVYGWDPDWTNKNSGNFRVLQLVLDGLKIQGCNPGFTQGRDAILAAELVNTNGENQCLIWEVFARRGLGFFADGGSVNEATDNIENFDPLPECLKTLKIYKTTATVLKTDENTDVELIIANHKDEMVNAVVSDLIPEGMSYVPGSSNKSENVENGQIFFNIDNFASGTWDTIVYQISHDNTINSVIVQSNKVDSPSEQNAWERVLIADENNIFRINSSGLFPTFSGENSWFVEERDEDTQAIIKFNNISVTGELPAIRIWHRINTEITRNGGFIEISNDGVIWKDAKDLYIRNGANCPLQFTTFAIPALSAFSGRTGLNDYVDTYIDVSSYKGETISLRFRFGTNIGAPLTGQTTAAANDEFFPADAGWFLDDLDLIDLVSYDSQACITTSEDEACTANAMLILDPQFVSGVKNNTIAGLSINIYPNPASSYIGVSIDSERNFDSVISILSMDGKRIISEKYAITANQNQIQLNTSSLSPGFYLVQVLGDNGLVTEKIIIQ